MVNSSILLVSWEIVLNYNHWIMFLNDSMEIEFNLTFILWKILYLYSNLITPMIWSFFKVNNYFTYHWEANRLISERTMSYWRLSFSYNWVYSSNWILMIFVKILRKMINDSLSSIYMKLKCYLSAINSWPILNDPLIDTPFLVIFLVNFHGTIFALFSFQLKLLLLFSVINDTKECWGYLFQYFGNFNPHGCYLY